MRKLVLKTLNDIEKSNNYFFISLLLILDKILESWGLLIRLGIQILNIWMFG